MQLFDATRKIFQLISIEDGTSDITIRSFNLLDSLLRHFLLPFLEVFLVAHHRREFRDRGVHPRKIF